MTLTIDYSNTPIRLQLNDDEVLVGELRLNPDQVSDAEAIVRETSATPIVNPDDHLALALSILRNINTDSFVDMLNGIEEATDELELCRMKMR